MTIKGPTPDELQQRVNAVLLEAFEDYAATRVREERLRIHRALLDRTRRSKAPAVLRVLNLIIHEDLYSEDT